MKDIAINLAADLKMIWIRHMLWKPLLRDTHDPHAAQMTVLRHIIKRNQHTGFGRKYGFASIKSHAEFLNAVPVHDYEALRPYVEQQDETKEPCLNPEHPLMYAQTSGTTGKPKYIPILNSTVARYRRSQHIVSYAKYAAIPGVFSGKILAIVSPAVEGRLASGTPYGSMSGLIYKSMPSLMRAKYVVPPEVFETEDYEEKYFLIALHALAERNVSMIATANPSTLLKLHSVMNQRASELIDALNTRSPVRAKQVQRLLSQNGVVKFADLWPDLKSVTTWTGGSCGALIPTLKAQLAETTRVVELGYLSSEFRGSITIDVINNLAIPAIHENFYEFIERDDRDCDAPKYLTVDELAAGKQYYILASTLDGLYRYDINDIVEVTGFFNRTPTLRFVQKGKGVINLTGEKLYEGQLLEAIARVKDELGIEFSFFILIGCEQQLEYTLYVEHRRVDLSALEAHLCAQNVEFEAKRKSDRLKPLKFAFIREGTGEVFKCHHLSEGQREAQYKVAHVQYRRECSFDFARHLR